MHARPNKNAQPNEQTSPSGEKKPPSRTQRFHQKRSGRYPPLRKEETMSALEKHIEGLRKALEALLFPFSASLIEKEIFAGTGKW